MPRRKPHILIIAGMDPSGNAGILRDVEIAHSFGVKTSVVVTSLTAQNQKKFMTTDDVKTKMFAAELKSVLPLSQYQAIKVGMLGNEKIVRSLVDFLKKHPKHPPLILDPVYASSTGGVLLTEKGQEALWKKLIPEATLWTPNFHEAGHFAGMKVKSAKDMEEVADYFWRKKKVPVLIKGHLTKAKVEDLFFDGVEKTWFVYPKRNRKGLRGTGCALSSLVAVHLARGFTLPKAVRQSRTAMDYWMGKEIPPRLWKH